MKAKFNEEKNTLKVNGKKFNVISAKSEFKAGDFKNGEWVNNKRYVTFEIEVIEEQPEAPEQPEQPQRKFKAGDKVRIKEGINKDVLVSASCRYLVGEAFIGFVSAMDEWNGKTMTITEYSRHGFIGVKENSWLFAEDWLEPWSDEKEELKKGDLAIFWDYDPRCARIAAFSKKKYGSYHDESGLDWLHAVKFECTKEQKEFFNKVRKGEITL